MGQYRIGIYPGTFDPITNGHIDIILRAVKIVDKLIIAVSTGFGKKAMFTTEQRCEFIKKHLSQCSNDRDIKTVNIEIQPFNSLLVDFARQVKANLVIRGLRAVSDFEYEFQMACMNQRLDANIETIFLPASEKNQFISSKLVKEIASLDGKISEFVSSEVQLEVKKYYDDYKKNSDLVNYNKK